MDAIQPKRPRLLSLLDYADPLLRQTTERVNFPLSDEDKQLIEDMKYSIQPAQLKKANAPWDGASGMAANQWGINKQIFLFCPESDTINGLEVVINPRYEPLINTTRNTAEEELHWEGCFSVPLAVGNVKRYTHIRTHYQDETGKSIVRELSGWPARVFQHETDHLNGQLYYDLSSDKCMDKRKFPSKEAVNKFYEKIYEERKKELEKLINCPCGTGIDFNNCCGPYLAGKKHPNTPEALMRSRYTAFVKENMDYIKKTMRPPALLKFNENERHHNQTTHYPQEWLGLEVITAYNDVNPNIGYVEFIAKYKQSNQKHHIHELSKFHREEGRWYYVDGEYLS